jgi:Rrf2 family protein
MKLTAKTRYGIAVLVLLAAANGRTVPLTIMAQRLGLSKIYLEQVLAVLRSHQLVSASKGPTGGYRLEDNPDLGVILKALEPDLFTLPSAEFTDERMNQVLDERIYTPLHYAISATLSNIPLSGIAERYAEAPMYYI